MVVSAPTAAGVARTRSNDKKEREHLMLQQASVSGETYRPRRPSNVPSRRRRPRAALSRSTRTLRWTSGRERAPTGLASAAGAGPAFAEPIVGATAAAPGGTRSA